MFTKTITHTHPQLRWSSDPPHLSRSWVLEVSIWLWSIPWFYNSTRPAKMTA